MDCGFVINLDISSAKQTENAHITNTKAEEVVVLFPPKKSRRTPNVPWEQVCAMIGDQQAIRGDQLTLRQSTSVLLYHFPSISSFSADSLEP